MGRKFSVLVVVLAILFGCSNKESNAIEENFDKDTTVDSIDKIDDIDIQLLSVDYTDKIESFLTYGDHITLLDSDYKFLEVVVRVSNRSEETLDVEKLSLFLEGDNIEDKIVIRTEDKMHYAFKNNNQIDVDETNFVHIFTTVKKEVNDFDYDLKINGSEFELQSSINNIEYKNYKYSDVIKTEDFEFSIFDSQVTKEIRPSNLNGDYSYLSVDRQDESFFVYEVIVNNTSDKDLPLEEVFNIKNSELEFVSDFTWYVDNPSTNKLDAITLVRANEEMSLLFVSIIKGSTTKSELEGSIGDQLYKIIEK